MKIRYLLLTLASCFVIAVMFIATSAAQPSPRRIEIAASRFQFAPNEVTLKVGEPVVLVFSSNDVTHGIRFKELNLDAKIAKGSPVELPLTPQTAGDFVGHCASFCGAGHGGMMLTIHVVQ